MWKDGSGSYGCSGCISDLEGLKRNDTNLQIQILAGRWAAISKGDSPN